MLTSRDENHFRQVMQDRWVNDEQKRALQRWFENWTWIRGIHLAKLPDEETMAKLSKESIETLGLSTKPYHALRRHGVHTVGALLSLRADEVRDIQFIGNKGWQEIERVLAARGWYLAPEPIVSEFEKWLEGKE